MALLRHSSGPRASRGGDGFKGAGGVSPRRHVARGRPRLTARPRAAAQPLPSTPGASPRRGHHPDVHARCGGRGGGGTGPHVLAPGGAPDDVTAGAAPLLDAETEGRTGNPGGGVELLETVRVTRGAWPPDAPWPPPPAVPRGRRRWARARRGRFGTRAGGGAGWRCPADCVVGPRRRDGDVCGTARVTAEGGTCPRVRRAAASSRASSRRAEVATPAVAQGTEAGDADVTAAAAAPATRPEGTGRAGWAPGAPSAPRRRRACPGAPRGAQRFHIPRYFLLK